MSQTLVAPAPTMTLPSDQEASGRLLGSEEIAALSRVIETGTLTCTKGNLCKNFEERVADMVGSRFVIACASGSAAVHCAIAAIDPEPGDEIITTSITDMGALTPILYQGAIPVFVDVDPRTGNVTPETIERCITDRTRAVIVTHLFGNPADIQGICDAVCHRGIHVIEDSAQAYGCRWAGKHVGTFCALGAFSLQQGKHITTGEGGFVVTDDPDLARRVRLFVNKAWGYGDPNPDHYFLALNYRLTELQGAVALAQMDKLEHNINHRRAMAARLSSQLQGLAGVSTPWIAPEATHSYWRYCLFVDGGQLPGGSPALGAELRKFNIAAAPRYIQKPAFQCAVIRDQKTFGSSRWPFTLARPEAVDYAPARFPGTFKFLEDVLVLPFNERFTEQHIDYIADAVRTGHSKLRG